MNETTYTFVFGTPAQALMSAIFGGSRDHGPVEIEWTWEGRRYDAVLDGEDELMAQARRAIKEAGGGVEVDLIWGRDIYRPAEPRLRHLRRLTASGWRKLFQAAKEQAEAARREKAERERAEVARIIQAGIRFTADGGVYDADGGYNPPEQLRELLPQARPWTRARYALVAMAAARAGLPNAEAHLRLVLETIGASGQGQAFDAILFGTPEEAAAAVRAIEPDYPPDVIDAVLGWSEN